MTFDRNLLPVELLSYYDRVGADVLNFRRAMVRIFKGKYYLERAIIKVTPDGEVSCSNKEFAPTEEEIKNIKAAIVKSNFPKSIEGTEASLLNYLSRKGIDANTVHTFVNRKKGGIIMAQQRVEADGEKHYLPHTFFSDGEWRCMEPDGLLPFWKPSTPRHKPRIMIHEGAKAAYFVDDLVNNPSRLQELRSHPWGQELCNFEHWGMIGGALAPHRTDYDELRAERPTEVIYVCDNDFPGREALTLVSKNYGRAMKGIYFDEKWPPSWDMADPMPNSLFVDGRYIGPPLRALTQMATWATELVPSERGRPYATLKREFIEEICHCVVPEVYVHVGWPNMVFGASEFNNRIKPFSHVDDTTRLIKGSMASKGVNLRYTPAAKSGLFIEDQQMCLNTHVGTSIKAEEGDPTPFLDFMQHLVPNQKDRTEMLRWCATLIARPDIKMLYAVLLISERQGVGKGTLGEKILAPLMGTSNVSYPSESEIVDSGFNAWAAHRRLAVVHEIYAGHSSKAYNKLKAIVTDRYISVNKKYLANYEIENWLHIFACSNSARAIQLTSDDRRWFVPQVTDEKRTTQYWENLNHWLSYAGGLGIIKWWASEWLKTNSPVLRGDAAPWSDTKNAVIEEGYSPGMTLVANFLDKVNHELANGWGNRDVIMYDISLVDLVRNFIHEGRYNDKLERPMTLRKVAKQKGWYVHPERAYIGQGYNLCRIICSKKSMTELPTKELVERYPPLDVQSLARQWQAV